LGTASINAESIRIALPCRTDHEGKSCSVRSSNSVERLC
jgi:hypothetical protein